MITAIMPGRVNVVTVTGHNGGNREAHITESLGGNGHCECPVTILVSWPNTPHGQLIRHGIAGVKR